MNREKLIEGNRYQFVMLSLDVFNSAEMLRNYSKNGHITLLKFQTFCKDIYEITECLSALQNNGFELLFFGQNKVQNAIEVISKISNSIDFFNKTISLIPYNLEIRCAIGSCLLIYKSEVSLTIHREKNPVCRILNQANAGDILIIDNIYSQLSRDQKRYFYFEKIYNQYIIFKADTAFLFNRYIDETNNVIEALGRASEKFRFELKGFSEDCLGTLIDIYKYIDIFKTLIQIVLECNDIEFFSKNVSAGNKFIYKLKAVKKIVSESINFADKKYNELSDEKLFIIFNGISNQLEWFDDVELNDEIEKLDFILDEKKSSKFKRLDQLISEKNQTNCSKLIDNLLSCNDQHKQYYYVKRILYLYFEDLILYIISAKADNSKKDKLDQLKNILWEHLHLFYCNGAYPGKKNTRLSFTRIPYISEKFEDFLVMLGKNHLHSIVKMIAKYDEADQGIIAKALSFHGSPDIVNWSIKHIGMEDLWELVASPETPLPKLWQIYKEILRRKESKDFDKVLFFTCLFEKIKKELIRTNRIEDIELIEKFLKEFLSSKFCVMEHYNYRLEELQLLYKHKVEVLNKPDNIFEKMFNKITQSIKGISIKKLPKEMDLPDSAESLKKLKPWVQLQLAKQGFFPVHFICQQKDLDIARAALKKLTPANIPNLFSKGFLNHEVFFELANMRKFFVNSFTVKALLKHKLATKKHYNAYRKFLNDADLKEIKHYTNNVIKDLIKKDLKK